MKINNIWSDGFIIQQGKKIRIAGTGVPFSKICAFLTRDEDELIVCSKNVNCASDGKILIEFSGIKASFNTYTLKISSDEEIYIIKDILVGEVFLTSGQSNMELALRCSLDREVLLKRIGTQKIRFICSPGFAVGEEGNTKRSNKPLCDISYSGWKTIQDEEAVLSFSSLCISFALKLYETLNIPIGILGVAVGGTPIEAWMSNEQIYSKKSIVSHLKKTGRFVDELSFNNRGLVNYAQMTGLFNEKIAPLTSINIRGVLWLQGESSANDEAEAAFYRMALTGMIKDWNKKFRNPLQPFFVAHIASQNYQMSRFGVCYLNEAISDVANALTKCVTIIPTNDFSLDWIIPGQIDSHPIHPGIKVFAGERFAKAVICKCYTSVNNEVYNLPVLDRIEKNGCTIKVFFNNTGTGLKTRNSLTVKGFTIAGVDGFHLEANAKIVDENVVELSHENISNPTEVTYAFYDMNLHANLLSGDGIPAVPFRSRRKNQIYAIPRLWADCDLQKAWVNSFEWTLGGAKFEPLWSIGKISGIKKMKISYDSEIKSQGDSSIRLDYSTSFSDGYFVGISPEINLTGYEHCLANLNFMSVDINNPDNRTKTFAGVLIKTASASIYMLPIIESEQHKVNLIIPSHSGFVRYKISLKEFFACYLIKENKTPPDMRDVCEMQFTFRDENKQEFCSEENQQGTLFIDNIVFGR